MSFQVNNPLTGYYHRPFGLGPGRVGSRVTHQLQNVGRVPQKLTRSNPEFYSLAKTREPLHAVACKKITTVFAETKQI